MSSSGRERPEPEDLTPREARDRYLRRRRPDSTEQSISGWEYRLKLFIEWCEEVGLEHVGDLRGFDLDEYYEHRSAEIAPATLEGEMWTLKMFCRFLEDLGAVDDGLAEKVRIPDISPEDRSEDTKLEREHAEALRAFYARSEDHRGTRAHTFLELAWVTGARQGGLRALDIRDVHLTDSPYLEFRHRPDTGTPLKNKLGGERPVAIPPTTAAILEEYISTDRYEVRDESGRQPLVASAQGRPGPNTLRVWSYMATEPCIHSPCPHGKERETCQWTKYAHAS